MKLLVLLLFLMASTLTYGTKKYKVVVMETNLGTMKIKLYEHTPVHSENFLKLAKGKKYDSLLFHRVIKDFMIQGGSSDSRGAAKGKTVGVTDPGYTIAAEIRPEYFHKRGVLAAARQGDVVNPEKKSSGEQFYIVHGRVHTEQELNAMEQRKLVTAKNELGTKLYKPKENEHRRYLMAGEKAKADSLIFSINQEIERQFATYHAHVIPANVREIYKTIGGAPFLDGDYTVFGEVIEGLDVLDKIAAQKTGLSDRPEEDVVILSTKLKRK